MTVQIRPARTCDVAGIRRLVDQYVPQGILLDKPTVTLYEDVQEFSVAVDGRQELVGCGALHVMWEDLAEIRTLAVDPRMRGTGVGHRLLDCLLDRGRDLGVHRLFCLTFETEFFGAHGFREIDEIPIEHNVYDELLRSYDEGIAEFLALEHVKPNILGNTRMVLDL